MAATGVEPARRYVPEDYTDFAHTGPGTLAGRYLRRFWQPVYLARDLLPGHAKPIRIMSEDFTLYRGEGGTAHAVAFRCAHRGTQLSTGWVEDDCIRCFYHGWKYDGAGQCVEQPAEEASFAQKVRIRSYPTEEYLGLIFVYLGDTERGDTGAFSPPPLPRYPRFEQEGLLDAIAFVRLCNYFNDLENACDPVHVGFVHGESAIAIDGDIDLSRVLVEETESGISVATIKAHEGGGLRVNQYLMPNIQVIKLPPLRDAEQDWRDFISWRVPVDDEHYLSCNVNLLHIKDEDARRAAADAWAVARQQARASIAELGQAVLAGTVRIADVQDQIANVVNLQDEVALCGQGVIPDRLRERLGRSDVGVILLRKIWRRELEALATDQPLKPWTPTGASLATTGI